jgi:hypothetical protein
MVLRELVERFERHAPFAVMFRAILERTFAAERLDALFARHAQRQSQHEILFSTMVELMGSVAAKMQPSMNAAYKKQQAELSYSVNALYRKLQRVEVGTSRALVRETARDLGDVIRRTKATNLAILPGFRVKIVDGNHLAATERRLKVMKSQGGAPLPGLALPILDPELGLIQDVILCEDAHAQERSLWPELLACVGAGEAWLMDRNFCTANILFGIIERDAYFVVRQHAQSPATELRGKRELVVRDEQGLVYEQAILIKHEDGREETVRRISLELHEPTRDGETEIHVLTNLPAHKVSALRAVQAYRQRWTIEKAFLEVAQNTHGEIETLGYPAAALFAFSLALVVFNIHAVLQAAVRATHDPAQTGRELSVFYVAHEVASASMGLNIALDAAYWTRAYADLSEAQFVAELLRIASGVDIRRYQKHPRGPKKKPAKKTPARQHTATQRLLKPPE